MVSKVAVMAIVGILAVPILLGYALNLEQTTETDYQTTGDSVNVTQLLQNETSYSYTKASVYDLNTNFGYTPTMPIMPTYETTGYVKSTLPWEQYHIDGFSGGTEPLTTDTKYSIRLNYDSLSTSNFRAEIYHDATLLTTINGVNYLYFDSSTDTIVYCRFTSGSDYTQNVITGGGYTSVSFTKVSGSNVSIDYAKQRTANTPTFVSLASGFHFNYLPGSPYLGETHDTNIIKFPNYTRNAILTVDLNSITDANYSFGIGTQCYIEKTTTGGDVSWQGKPRPRISDNIVPVTDLYYDPTSSNNTYQIKIWVEPDGEPSTVPGYNKYIQHYEFRYIGAWPSLIGEANYYHSYDIQAELIAQTPNFNSLLLGGFSARSPIMRVDEAEFRAMEYQVMADKTYDPAAFKTNPATTINDPVIYGTSFTFGGITYAVKNGNITMGNHDIPVKGLVLSSVPNEGGGYDNKIGNTVISTTAAPSAITFNGKWSASITTTAQEEYQVTKTEWKAGSFAWDGIDQNFIMAGLLASLAAFVGVGIYARRSKATIWPLLIVCGGAALLFFVML